MMNLPARNLHHAKILRSAEREYQLMINKKKRSIDGNKQKRCVFSMVMWKIIFGTQRL
jgi:hypothetical protein